MLILLTGVLLAGVALTLTLRLLFHDHLQGDAIVARVGSYTGVRRQAAASREGLLGQLIAAAGSRFAGRFDTRDAQGQLLAAGLYSVTPQRLVGYRLLALIVLPGSLLLAGSSGAVSRPLALTGTVLAVAVAWRLPAM